VGSVRRTSVLVGALALTVAGLGVVVLAGWALDQERLTRVLPGLVTMAGYNAIDVPEHSLGYVYLPATAGIVATSMFTANIGAKLGQRVNVRVLKAMLACLLVLVSIRMILGIE